MVRKMRTQLLSHRKFDLVKDDGSEHAHPEQLPDWTALGRLPVSNAGQLLF